MARLLQISQLGHPVLRDRAKEVEDVADPAMQALIDDMIETCRDVDGVGIAAPQVYRSLRLFIVASRPNPRYPQAPQMKPLAMINPVLLSVGEEAVKDWEGCLSIPGIRGHVPRHRTVTVSFTHRDGRREERTFDGFLARIVEHEFDHIEGRVFLDRTASTDLATEKEFQKWLRVRPPAD
ncbi:MAG: peptide deformylase [Rhodospirillales bacterium]